MNTPETYGAIFENGQLKSRYGLHREVDDEERFVFRSANKFPKKLWLPKYAGHAVLASHVAVVEMINEDLTVIVDLDPETALYASSSDLKQRMWAGNQAVSLAIGNYLNGNLVSSDRALDFYHSLGPEQLDAFSLRAAQAQ